MSEVIAPNTSQRIEMMLLDASNAEVTGASATIKIRRKSDGKYWNGSSFQTSPTTVAMTELSAANDPGRYYYIFATSGLPDDEYFFTGDANTGTNIPQIGSFRTGYVSTIAQVLPMIQSASDSGVWTVEEKDRLLKAVKEILKSIAESIAVTSGIKETIETAFVTENASTRQALLTETQKVTALVNQLIKDVLCNDNGRALALEFQTKIGALFETFAVSLAETVTKQEDKIRGLVDEVVKDRDPSKIHESILLIEQILLKTTPTEILENINNEDPS